MKSMLLFGLIGAFLFIFGVGVGHYHLPPFPMMQAVKQYLPVDALIKSWLPGFRSYESSVDVVMLGDSITARTDWKELFPQARIINLGISGDTSAGALNRLADVINRQPRVVFVMIGVNDFLADFPLDIVERNIQFIAVKLADKGIQPVIQSTLYVSKDIGKEINTRIKTLNDSLRNWCAEKHVLFVDLNDFLSVDKTLSPKYSEDGTHLNREGYAVWQRVIMQYVQRATSRRSHPPSPLL